MGEYDLEMGKPFSAQSKVLIVLQLSDMGREGSICTFYELQEQYKEVDCLDEVLLHKVLELLMKKGNIELMKGSSGKYSGFKVLKA